MIRMVRAVLTVRLPMAVAQHLDSGFHFDQALFRGRHRNVPRRERNWPGFAHVRRADRAAGRMPLRVAISPPSDFKWNVDVSAGATPCRFSNTFARPAITRLKPWFMATRRRNAQSVTASKLTQQLSVFAVAAKGSSASPAPAGCGTCGDPRGPGACSLPDLD